MNYFTDDTEKPYFEEEYVLAALDLGNGKLGELGLSYFDKLGGGYAVGTRRSLNADSSDPQQIRDCNDAFLTFKDLEKGQQLELPFALTNPCRALEEGQAQKLLGRTWIA